MKIVDEERPGTNLELVGKAETTTDIEEQRIFVTHPSLIVRESLKNNPHLRQEIRELLEQDVELKDAIKNVGDQIDEI